MPKRVHDGLKKRCPRDPATGKRCARKQWAKCSHPWHFSFHHAGREWRFSLDTIARARGQQPPATKTDAEAWRDTLRGEIRSGTFVDPTAPLPAAPIDTRLTFGDVCDKYLSAYVGKVTTPEGKTRWTSRHLRPRTAAQAEYHLNLIRVVEVPAAHSSTVKLEAKPVDAVTKADIEAVREARRPHGVVGCNRLLARLRHCFNWAIGEGFTESSPFKRGPITVVKLEHRAEVPRTRRLLPDEETGLLLHARQHHPLLRALIVAALSTGCRQGELLSLQWSQIRRDDKGASRWMILPGSKTKTHESREIPIGTTLSAELEMRRLGPDGKEHTPEAYVFGNDCGEQVDFPKLGWMTTVLRAHGVPPVWNATKSKGLSVESRAVYQQIDLNFHDLRREFASRLRESGATDHDVRDFLGHANITTTSRYLKSTPTRLASALTRLEQATSGDGFAHDSHTSVEASDASESAQTRNAVN